MFVRCAWCRCNLGTKEPLYDKSVTHGICPQCVEQYWAVDLADGDDVQPRTAPSSAPPGQCAIVPIQHQFSARPA